MRNRAPIMMNGRTIGYLSLSWSEEIPVGSGLPPSVGLGGMPASPRAARALSGDGPSRQQPLGGDHAGTHSQGQIHHRHLDPAHKQPHQEPSHKRYLLPEHKGQQERDEQTRKQEQATPLPKSRPEEQIKVPHGDAAFGGPPEQKIKMPHGDAAFGGPPSEKTTIEGQIDRSHHRAYLAAHPELREKILSIMKSEQGLNRLGTQSVAEETFNRADVRNHPLERVARWTSEPGGYYADPGYRRGRVTNPTERAILEESLEKALSGSNVSNWATDNSSGSLAAREKRGGEFTLRSEYTGESFFTRNSENARHKAWQERPMARWGKEPTFAKIPIKKPEPPVAAAPVAKNPVGHATPISAVKPFLDKDALDELGISPQPGASIGDSVVERYGRTAATREIDPNKGPGYWVGAGKNRVWVPEKNRSPMTKEMINPDKPGFKPQDKAFMMTEKPPAYGGGSHKITTPNALPDYGPPPDDE
jgi:hypothetical protein